MRPLPSRLVFVAALALCLVAGGAVAAENDEPRIYRWVDAEGITHYTTHPDRIPAALRGRLRRPDPQPERRVPPSTDVWAERDRPPDGEEPDGAAEFDGAADDFGVEDPAREARIQEIDAQIEVLLGHIASDEETLKQRVVGVGADPLTTGADEELRTIAARLPGLLAELRGLRDERATLEAR